MNKLFADNSIRQLVEKMRSGELVPAALLEASIQNINEADPEVMAWVVHARAELVEKARTKGANEHSFRGLLPHIPVAVKDIYNTEDFPTQMGSPLWKGFAPGNDARAVHNLKREGAVVVGKTVTAEFAVHALEKTLNPYDKTRTPGTSSSGSAVAIALGMVPFATGTQTAGSIVRPASFCGVYGMKPSFGFIPRTGMLKTTDSLDTLGFFTIYQEDLRRGFDAMRVHGLDYPISNAAISDTARQEKPEGRPWRVGFARTHTWEHAPQYAKDAVEGFIESLKTTPGVEVNDAELPESMQRSHETHATIYNKALSYYFQTEYKYAEHVSPVMQELIAAGNEVTKDQYLQALAAQAQMIRDMDAYFGEFDILISLSTAGEAPLREVTELPDPALMWTLTHLPVVSVPKFTSPSGLPFGMQVVARKYNDYLLLNFLAYLESKKFIPTSACKLS